MLAIIRHAQAEGNTSHRFIGWSQVGLDDLGGRQAELLAQRLAGFGVDRIVSSGISRAMQTARSLADRLGLDVEVDDRFREIDNGEWTGLLPTEIEAQWPEMWSAYVSGEDVARPAGEQWADVRLRVRRGLEELSQTDGLTAVFTHAGPVMLSAEWALGLTLPGNIFRGVLAAPANTSITTIDAGKLVTYADAGHLGVAVRTDVPYAAVTDEAEE